MVEIDEKKKSTASTNLKLTEVLVYNYSELAGCGYVFKKSDGSFLLPVNMPDTLKHDSLKLNIDFIVKNIATTCMVGPVIELTHAEYSR